MFIFLTSRNTKYFFDCLETLNHKRGDKKVHSQPNHQNFSKFSRFLDFFLRIFFKKTFKNTVCFNLTTKTSKYHLNVSQVSDQCFRGFRVWANFQKNRSTFFFEIFLRDLLKFIFWVLSRNLEKTLKRIFNLFWATFCKNLSEFSDVI